MAKKSTVKKKLDKQFSKYIRARDKRCQRCGKETSLQCSHVVPRTNHALRWDEKNAKALCVGCHLYFWHKDPIAAKEWFAKEFPDRVEYLNKKRNEIIKMTTEDYQELYEMYRAKTKELENEQISV